MAKNSCQKREKRREARDEGCGWSECEEVYTSEMTSVVTDIVSPVLGTFRRQRHNHLRHHQTSRQRHGNFFLRVDVSIEGGSETVCVKLSLLLSSSYSRPTSSSASILLIAIKVFERLELFDERLVLVF